MYINVAKMIEMSQKTHYNTRKCDDFTYFQ